jgi:hypothetical protein
VATLDQAVAIDAVEIDRVVSASGNLGVCGQQFWLGPQRAGRTLTLWIDTTTVHLNLDGQHLKTLPSRLTSIDLARLRAQGARPAGPPPARPSGTQLSAGAPVEIHRSVNAVGMVSIGGTPTTPSVSNSPAGASPCAWKPPWPTSCSTGC